MLCCSAIGRTGPDESVQPIRTFVLDGYPVAKLQFWQNPRVTGQVAILTAHGCWHVDLAKEGDQAGKPCKSCLAANSLHRALVVRCCKQCWGT